MVSRRAPHSGLGQFGRFESRHSRESKTVRSRRGLFTGVRGIRILRTSPFGDSRKFALTEFSEVHLMRVLRSSPRKLPQLVYLGDAVTTVGLVGWSLLSNGVGLVALLPRGRVNHRD